ncbi:MAG TPA: PASTA domain-containing protein, partial [Nocardioides sp.]|nr:PASTA domain-containing protein [Nocardioides sp.]
SALDYSHRAGIIHRDIKPGNVMLTPSGDVKVMDFGIARAISDASSTMTQTAAVVGTAQYLSPEQARGETVDSRSDVYSAGCLLYELLTGRPPFVGDSPVAVAYQHVREPAMPPSDHDTDLPPEVDAIVMKALAKRLEDRYQSAAAMRNDIERYLAGRPVEATVPPPPPPVDQPTTVVAPTPAETPQLPPEDEDEPRNRWLLWVVLGALVIALVAAAYFLWPKLFEEAPTQEQVPSLVNLTEEEARSSIGDAGLSVGDIEREASDTVRAGHVIEQSPDADDYVDPGTEVDLVISLGKPEKAVPSVVNSLRKEAVLALRGEGFKVEQVERESDETKNQVIEQDPAAGTMIQEGAVVTIYYSDGPEKVPDVVGMTQQDAVRAIEAAGFTADVFESDDTTEPAGTVFRQSPEADQTPPAGTTITIFVSTFVEPTTPTVPTTPTTPTTPIIPPPP